ncbi:MAG: AI-2E family transporter [Deltaproteobacteria bacterium]|nr:AI-2E family transporter [Deltaproteobacteria bacterium]
MTSKQLSIAAFFILLILILIQLFKVFDLFLVPIMWAVILAIAVFPVYRWFLKILRGKKTVASLIVTLLVIVVTTGPMVFFSGALVREVLGFYTQVAAWIQERGKGLSWEWLATSPFGGLWLQIQEKTAALNIEVVPLTVKFLQKMTNLIVGQLEQGAKNFFVFVFDYLITIMTLFFFLRDGESMTKGLKDMFPMSMEHKEAVLGRIEQTVSAVVRGVGLTGITQGVLAGLAFWILGIPYPLFLALLIAFLAFLPIGGAAMIWIPSSVYLYFQGSWGRALILFLYGTLVISMVDNFLKPLLIGEKTRLPILFLFFAILGGLSFYGFVGIFLGPVLVALFLTLIQIYKKEYPSGS